MRNAKNLDNKKVIIYQIYHSEFCHFIALSKGRIIRNACYTIIILWFWIFFFYKTYTLNAWDIVLYYKYIIHMYHLYKKIIEIFDNILLKTNSEYSSKNSSLILTIRTPRIFTSLWSWWSKSFSSTWIKHKVFRGNSNSSFCWRLDAPFRVWR